MRDLSPWPWAALTWHDDFGLDQCSRPDTSQGALPAPPFLGLTFVYAGVQKLSDPGFLHAGAPSYIGTQLHGFANGTPAGFILTTFAAAHPALAGVGVAITEILTFSAVCTPAGCTVGYEGGVIVCPCHGGEYSAETGEV